jgi:hypothetical protein
MRENLDAEEFFIVLQNQAQISQEFILHRETHDVIGITLAAPA